MAYLVALLSLGCVRLKPTCKFCAYEIALTNMRSHLLWHLKRGEWTLERQIKMKLSEYIQRLQVIARQQKQKGIDPEVCIRRFSDLTTDIGNETAQYPMLVEAVPRDGYLMRSHATMPDSDKAAARCYVELASGN